MTSFDTNFCFKVPSALENARLKLIPWNTAIHSTPFFSLIAPHPELFNYLPFGPFSSRETFDLWFEGKSHNNKTTEITFAVFDKTPGYDDDDAGFAGMITLLNASPAHLSVEIGLVILPAFHRTHVSSNAVGLLLHYCLNPPRSGSGVESSSLEGLGLRRVYWNASPLNVRSIALAERLGMKLEGILRWDLVLPSDRVQFGKSLERRKGDPKENQPGRDTARLSICWDDWMEGGRVKVDRVMSRKY